MRGGRFTDPRRLGDRVERQGDEIDEVDQGVEHHHDDRAPDEPEGKRALGIAHFAGRKGRPIPAVVGPEGGDHADADGREKIDLGQ